MVDTKKIAVAGAAVVLVAIVTVFATSYMSDFGTPRTSTTENEFKALELKQTPVLGSQNATVTIIEVGDTNVICVKFGLKKLDPKSLKIILTLEKQILFLLICHF